MLHARYRTEDDRIEIGVDEAGRGSFWGPMMAGAVSLPLERDWTAEQRTLFQQLRDSKRISPKKRMVLYHQLKTLVPHCAVGVVHASEINEHGIQWANKEAFQRAVRGLPFDLSSCRILIDGTIPMSHMGQEDEEKDEKHMDDREEHLIVNGDDRYLAIAAASILAKVSHDLWIQEYGLAHPDVEERYDLIKSKGYGTMKHREAIQHYGGHELHRVVYIQNWLPGVTRQTTTRGSRRRALDFNECLIQTDTGSI